METFRDREPAKRNYIMYKKVFNYMNKHSFMKRFALFISLHGLFFLVGFAQINMPAFAGSFRSEPRETYLAVPLENKQQEPSSRASLNNEPSIYVTNMKQLFPYWGRYLRLDPKKRDKFRYVFYVRREEKGEALDAYKLWYLKGQKKVFLKILKTGRIINMPSLEVYREDPKIYTDHTETDSGIALRAYFEPVLQKVEAQNTDHIKSEPFSEPGAKAYEVSVEDLRASYEQFGNVYQYILGLRGLVTPKMNWIVFAFDAIAPEAIAIDFKGKETMLYVEHDKVYFRPKNKKLKGAITMKFGREPIRIWFES